MSDETRVDVLAVMDDSIEVLEMEACHLSAGQLEEAREAVAELIEKECTLAKVLSVAHVGRKRAPRWSHVAVITSHGSGVSSSLCRQFGLDPDEIVGGRDPVNWSALARIGTKP
jgi:hypothetical protein